MNKKGKILTERFIFRTKHVDISRIERHRSPSVPWEITKKDCLFDWKAEPTQVQHGREH